MSCALWAQEPFVLAPGCKLPFDDIKSTDVDLDKTCPVAGGATDKPKILESTAKNDLCEAAKPKPITYGTFTKLQAVSDGIDGLRNQLKESRDVVRDLVALTSGGKVGEGSVVQFVAYLLNAHVSNKSKGELVNCKKSGIYNNDIHIELVKSAGEDDACNSVTAEMSPHFRPDAWDDLVELTLKRPVRVTGAMFFDGSHAPCHDGKRPSPQRISVWEIHPVYQFDVCKYKTLAACKVSDKTVWIPLNEWEPHSETEEP
jgi:hypothetical protein